MTTKPTSRLASRLMSEIEYMDQLNEEQKKWLYHFLAGTAYASAKQLSKILPEGVAHDVAADCVDERNSYRRDMMYKWEPKKEVIEHEKNFENYHMHSLGGTNMHSFEDAMIKLIDASRGDELTEDETEQLEENPPLRPYGNGEPVSIGADVAICIEGHHFQGKIARVIAKRGRQYLVAVESKSTTISMYVGPHEIARVNQMKAVV